MIDPITTGLAAASAVAACVSAFKDGRALFRRWREKKAANRRPAMGLAGNLEQALIASPSAVQEEYDRLSVIAGKPFLDENGRFS
jgi:hypothetical protein